MESSSMSDQNQPPIIPQGDQNFIPTPHLEPNPPSRRMVKISPQNIASAIIFITLVVVASYLGYLKYFLTPERILAKALANTIELKTFTFMSKTEFTPLPNNLDIDSLFNPLFPQTITIDFSGSVDLTNMETIISKNILEVSSEKETIFEAEAISFSPEIYFKVTKFKENKNTLALEKAGLVNQWIRIDPNKVKHSYDLGTLEQFQVNITGEQVGKLNQMLTHSNIFVVNDTLAPEKIDDQYMYHYLLGINPENAQLFLNTLYQELDKEQVIQLYKPLTEDLLESIVFSKKEQVSQVDKIMPEDFFENIDFFKIEVWIGKKDKMLHKVIVSAFYKGEQPVTIKLEYNQSHFNEKIAVDQPESSKPLDEVLNSVYFLPPENPAKALRDAQRRADLERIIDALHAYATDHNGILPSTDPYPDDKFPAPTRCVGTRSDCVNLETILVPTYLPYIPIDPSTGTAVDTAYTIHITEEGKINTRASGEQTPYIYVKK